MLSAWNERLFRNVLLMPTVHIHLLALIPDAWIHVANKTSARKINNVLSLTHFR
jgi:hypothetical protein